MKVNYLFTMERLQSYQQNNTINCSITQLYIHVSQFQIFIYTPIYTHYIHSLCTPMPSPVLGKVLYFSTLLRVHSRIAIGHNYVSTTRCGDDIDLLGHKQYVAKVLCGVFVLAGETSL
jgi:hypothetical protein